MGTAPQAGGGETSQNPPARRRKFLRWSAILFAACLAGSLVAQSLLVVPLREVQFEGGKIFAQTWYPAHDPKTGGQSSAPATSLPALLVLNELGHGAGVSRDIAISLCRAGMTVVVFEYYAHPLLYDPAFNVSGYFQEFLTRAGANKTINLQNYHLLGFGIGGSCALSLGVLLAPAPRSVIAVDPVANFSNVMAALNGTAVPSNVGFASGTYSAEMNASRAAQAEYWRRRVATLGYAGPLAWLNRSARAILDPISLVTRDAYNTTLIIRTTDESKGATTAEDVAALRERIHCEAWDVPLDALTARGNTLFHHQLAAWISPLAGGTIAPQPSVAGAVETFAVPAFVLLVAIAVVVLFTRNPPEGRCSWESAKAAVRGARGTTILLWGGSVVALGAILAWWGDLVVAALAILALMALAGCTIFARGRRTHHTYYFELDRRPVKGDVGTSAVLAGLLCVWRAFTFEDLLLPRGRNLGILLVIAGTLVGTHLVHVAASNQFWHSARGPAAAVPSLGLFAVQAAVVLAAWQHMHSPVLLAKYPVVGIFLLALVACASALPYLASRNEFCSLMVLASLVALVF